MSDNQSAGVSASAAPANPGAVPEAYFTVGPLKFSLMALATFGLFELYWFFRNWQIIRNQGRRQISPIARAFFAPIWTFSMGKCFKDQAQAENVSLSLPVALLGIAYLVVQALWVLPDPYWLVSFFAFAVVLPFDFAARRLNGKGELAPPTHGRFSGWNIAWLIVGSLLLVLAVIGAFIPEPSL